VSTFVDADARARIESALDVNLLVEAAAGTGKTTSLVRRVAALIRTGRCEIGTLAAITFTVKAAAHLREKVQEALEAALIESAGDERERIETALASLDRAFVGTTHAFCARLLRERPVEAGLDPDFEQLEETEAFLLMQSFWATWLDARAAAGDPALDELHAAGVRNGHLQKAFQRLVEYADVEMVSTPCARPDLQGAVDAVLEFLSRCEPCFPDDSMREKQDTFEVMMRDLVRRRNASDLADPLAQLAFLDLGNHVSYKATLKNWPNGPQAKALYQEYSQIASTLVRPTVRGWREYVHCRVLDFVQPAVEEFELQRQREGTLSYNDLLLRARGLLRDHPRVRLSFQRRFTHLLVDEFQDTDPIQAEVLFYLTGREVEERDWRKLTPKAGSLFIVGDPKQSIYRFRRADISTYSTVRARMEATGGEVLPLRTNFRSTATICDFVNATFPSLFDAKEVAAGRQAEHVDLSAAPVEMPAVDARPRPLQASLFPTPGSVDRRASALQGVYVLETPDQKYEDVASAEAECVARWIRRAIDTGTHRAGEFLLVSEMKRRLHLYASALEAQGIRYELTGGEGFATSEELSRVMPVLRAVADPDDPVALVAVLRGPLSGASDADLYRYVKGGGAWSVWHRGNDVPPAVAAGLDLIEQGIELARHRPPAAAIGGIFERTGVIATAAMEDEGSVRAGNLLLALTIARRESAHGASFQDIVEHLDELLESEARIEELDADPAARDVVRLMNLHQVKGLEARVVFLIDPADEWRAPAELYVDRTSEPSRGYLAVIERQGYSVRSIAVPSGWDAMAQAEGEFRKAERMRLLYVAATRAKELLVIGTRVKSGVRAGIWAPLTSRIADRFVPHAFGARQEPAGAPTESVEDAKLRIAARAQEIARPTYSVLPITKLAHDTHEQLVRAEEGLGKGTSWGRVLHRLFEALVRNEQLDVRGFAENLLKDEERDPVEVDEVVTVVDAVRSSPLWMRLRNADERYVEVPFALMVPCREAGLDHDGETLLHGVIDLVLREGARWLIVDYKSDATSGRLPQLIDYYRPQVEHYARFWSKLTGAETDAALFFVDRCEVVVVGSR
jgi:ATP-dependent helicase/nuclease subunit A